MPLRALSMMTRKFSRSASWSKGLTMLMMASMSWPGPLTWALGLPMQTGVPLIFGVLRKELSLIMLSQALGTMAFDTVLTPLQMFVYAVFVVFYVPCIATLMVLKRELGTKGMLQVTGLTVIIALVAGLAARAIGVLMF